MSYEEIRTTVEKMLRGDSNYGDRLDCISEYLYGEWKKHSHPQIEINNIQSCINVLRLLWEKCQVEGVVSLNDESIFDLVLDQLKMIRNDNSKTEEDKVIEIAGYINSLSPIANFTGCYLLTAHIENLISVFNYTWYRYEHGEAIDFIPLTYQEKESGQANTKPNKYMTDFLL